MRKFHKINKMLLKKLKTIYNKKLLFFTDYTSIFNSYKSEKELYNLNFIQVRPSYFYKVFYHESALGNEITARIFFNALIGKKIFPITVINCSFDRFYKTPESTAHSLDRKSPHKQSEMKLSYVQSIEITEESNFIASLRRNVSDHYWTSRLNPSYIDESTKSFFAFSNKNHFLTTPIYFPVPIQLKDGMKVYVQLLNKRKIKLGSIKSFDFYKKIFHFYIEYVKNELTTYSHYNVYFIPEKNPLLS